MNASCGANSAVLKTWVKRVITLIPTPRAKSAVRIGNPIATTEPKLISSTTIAARTPIPSDELSSSSPRTSSAGEPPTSTFSPPPPAAWAVFMIFLTSPSFSLSVVTLNWAVA